MIKKWLIAAVVVVGTALAESAPSEDVQNPVAVAQQRITKGLPNVQSPDGQWTVRNFSIVNNRNGAEVLHWDDKNLGREYLWTRWNPDSQRVVVLDQGGRAPMFFAAQLVNGKWVNVPDSTTPGKHPTGLSRVDRVELLNWISPTSLRIKDSFLVDDPTLDRSVAKTHWEMFEESLQFSGNSLRFVD